MARSRWPWSASQALAGAHSGAGEAPGSAADDGCRRSRIRGFREALDAVEERSARSHFYPAAGPEIRSSRGWIDIGRSPRDNFVGALFGVFWLCVYLLLYMGVFLDVFLM